MPRTAGAGRSTFTATSSGPTSGYRGKAAPAHYHTLRAVIKDCLPVDAQFPLIYRSHALDGCWRLLDITDVGTIEEPSIEYHLSTAGTGRPWSEDEFMQAAERVCALERVLQVRHWRRDRSVDEMVLPYFEKPEQHQSAYLDRRQSFDRRRFAPVIDEFFTLHGWEPKFGWPTEVRLNELGLSDVYQPVLDGAARAAMPQVT